MIFLLLYEHVRRVRAVAFFFLRVRTARKHMVYHMIRNVVFCRFLGHSTQTDCRSCSVDSRMHHPAKRSFAMCEHKGGVLRDFFVVIDRDICREHSLIGRRNCLMTEAANSSSCGPGNIDNWESYRQSSSTFGHSRTR